MGSVGARRVRPPRKAMARLAALLALPLVVLLGVLLQGSPAAAARSMDEEPVQMAETEAVAGGVAKLACDMHVSDATFEDKVTLVIWFKEGVPSPIYSFDARGKESLQQAKHWSDERLLGGRAYFRYSEKPAWLTVENVKEEDAGIYRCRVDFQRNPTRNSRVNLTVLVPPEKLVILDEHGVMLPTPHFILGPRNEGTPLNITCIATGGRPAPRVTWWQANALLDDTYESAGERRVRNNLYIDELERKQLLTVLTCQAINNNLTVPLSAAVTIDLNLPPLWVRLLGENRPLSADNEYQVQCEAVGTRPPPEMTWWKGGVPLRHAIERIDDDETNGDGNRTISTLTLVPTMEDGGKMLTCRAGTPLLSDPDLEDSWKLDVYHVPIVTLELGTNLNASNIREGVDVYFECNIKSNPWVYKVSWRHNGTYFPQGKSLNSNTSAGAIVSNQSLVLQSVTRSRTGIYTCVGSNHEGDGESNPVFLDVKFLPVCKNGQQRAYGVARGEPARVLCELEANPMDILFTWKFNNTSDAVDLPVSLVAADRSRSIATYTPMTELDYGTLLCWGRNELGVQHEPCVYTISPAGKPDPLHNCSILNQTAESLHVECAEGFDGGLTQHFIMEVYDADTQTLVRNVNSSAPVFAVSGLQSGLGFDISVFAANAKGRSDPVPLHAYTLKAAEKRTGTPSHRPSPPEKCRVVQEWAGALRVACMPGDPGATVVLQAFDAHSHRLLATTTASRRGAALELRGLPADGRPLLLSVYALTASAASEARTLYARTVKVPPPPPTPPPPPPPPDRRRAAAASPAILNITPVLGILIGGVAFLILVAIIIVVVMRLRNSSGNDSKPRDGASAEENGHTRTTDKASSVPLSKDTDESIDSQEEKNPDIIPQNSDTDYQDPDEKAFAKLNNAPNRIYASINPHIHSPSSRIYDNSGNMMNVKKPRDEVTYAELALPKQQPMYVGVPHTPGGVRRQEPTVYAQIDVSKQMPPQQQHPHPHPHHHSELLQQQPQDGNTASASLPLLHHHHLAAAYTPHPHQPTLRLLSPPGPPGPHPPMSTLGPLGPCPPDDELPACAETPLLPAPAQRESTV